MKTLIRFVYAFLILFFFTGVANLSAQWKNVAQNLISTSGRKGAGVLTYSSGNLWAAITKTVWMSPDEGKTWKMITVPIDPSVTNMISDIDFYDKNIGIVCSTEGDASITHDGGQTWTVTNIPNTHLTWQAKFVASSQIIVAFAIGNPDLNVYVSLDGGASWNATNPFPPGWNGFVNHIIVRKKDSSIYVLADQAGDASTIYYSSDIGKTWKQTNTFYTDCYSMALDPCFDNTFYVVNEGSVQVEPDNMGRIFFSLNRGNSFTPTNLQSNSYYAGSLMCAPAGTLYAQTQTSDGILRSTNQGNSWKSIGGPSGFFDCHFICCKDDNTIFALDTFGSVWVTYNSGADSLKGLPVPKLTINADTLFAHDSLTICDPPLSKTFTFSQSGCSPPHIIKAEIAGIDTSSFTQIPLSGNTLGVTFSPQHSGAEQAYYILTLNDDTKDTIVLQGFRRPSYVLSLATQDQSTDTIGGGISVPISIQNMDKGHPVDIVMHFTSELIYQGSYSLTGIPLDAPLEQWQGRSKLHIANTGLNPLQGYAHFLFLTDSSQNQSVQFDSLTILDQASPCEYNSGNMASSILTAPSGCGEKSLASFLREGKIPEFSIRPNPADNVITIESPTKNGSATFSVFDDQGSIVLESRADFHSGEPKTVNVSMLPNGKYFMRIECEGFLRSQSFIISR